MCDEEKKLTFVCFLYFFLRHAQKCRFFYRIVSIFVKKWAKSAKNVRQEKKSDLSNFYFIFFPPTWLKNPRRDSWTKEYNDCCLTDCRLLTFSQGFIWSSTKLLLDCYNSFYKLDHMWLVTDSYTCSHWKVQNRKCYVCSITKVYCICGRTYKSCPALHIATTYN